MVASPMNTGPLDYVSPNSPAARRPDQTRTPEQERFRRRVRYGFATAFVFSLIPYPTPTCPALRINLTDDRGRPVTDLVRFEWSATFHVDSRSGTLTTDASGSVSLPRQIVWASTARRVLSRIGDALPHGSYWAGQHAGFIVRLPVGFGLNGPATGLQLSQRWKFMTWAEGWHPASGDRVVIYEPDAEEHRERIQWTLANPGRWSGATHIVNLVLHTPTAAVNPPTSRPGG
jgi:hypothetical protein